MQPLNRISKRLIYEAFRSKLFVSYDRPALLPPKQREAWLYGESLALAIVDQLGSVKAADHAITQSDRLQRISFDLSDRAFDKLTPEPCQICEFIGLCAATRRTCQRFRLFVSMVNGSEQRVALRVPDKLWQNSFTDK